MLIMFFIVYPLCLLILSWFLLVKPLGLKRKWALLLLFVYFCGSFKDLISNLSGGSNIVAPEASYEVVTWMSTLNITVIISLFLALWIHVGRFIWKRLHREQADRMLSFRWQYLVITLAAAVLAMIGRMNAGALPEIHKYTLFDDRYPQTSRGFVRIAHISDTHFGTSVGPEMARKAMEMVNQTEPDLILITGDMIDGRPEKSREETVYFKKLKANYGVYAVHGNHEYYSYPEEWDPIWRDLGITILENEHVPIVIDGKTALYVAGISDRQALRVKDKNYEGPNPEKALKGIPPEAPVVLMSHRPAEFNRVAPMGVALTLAGHTHGGHIAGLDRVIRLLNGGYVAGYYAKGDSRLIVSSGTFLWGGFFCRLGTPRGEIAVIDLMPRKHD